MPYSASMSLSRKTLLWLALGLGGPLIGFVGAYFTGILEWFLPPPRVLACEIEEIFSEPAAGTHFTILVTDLAGDTDGSQTRHVVGTLEGAARQGGIQVSRTCRVLAIEERGDLASALVKTEETGRDWLAEQNADILIWGEVARADEVLRLRILPPAPIAAGATSYRLTETLELPESYEADLSDVLYAVALASVAPATEKQGQYLVDLLTPAMGKVERLLTTPPSTLAGRQLAVIQVSFGNAAVALGEQSGVESWLEKAVSAYQSALSEFTREKFPEDWAMTQNNLGIALRALGEREEGTARLEEAVEALRAALEVRTRERQPLQWAMTQNNLGNALMRLGEREE